MNTFNSNDPKFIAALKAIEFLINSKDLRGAAEQLNRLLRARPNDPRIYLLGAALAAATGNAPGELQSATRAYQLAPQWPIATLKLAETHVKEGATEEAMSMLNLTVDLVDKAVGDASEKAQFFSQSADLAQRIGDSRSAAVWLQKAVNLTPEDLGMRFTLAQTLLRSGQAEASAKLLGQLLLEVPDDKVYLLTRLQANIKAGLTEAAVRDGERLLFLEPDNEQHQFFAAVAKGETPPAQPDALISGLFDGYAARFDKHLVVSLQYKLPRDVAAMIHTWHPDRKGDVLDLGCGTGLLGVCLGPIEGVLVGVDLSGEMINQALRHQVYDKFHQVNVINALQATPGDQYHVITALEVLNYVGDLSSVLPNAHRILLTGGHFVFSCEASAETGDGPTQDMTLDKSTYRYTHDRKYVERLLKDSGFTDYGIEERVLRLNNNTPVNGYLITAVKSASAVKKTDRRPPKSATPVNLGQ